MTDKRKQPQGAQVTTVAPTLEGSAGKAWQCDLEKMRERYPENNTFKAGVAAWIVENKWADEQHPYTIIGVVDLSMPNRDGNVAAIRVEGATHELFVCPMPTWQVPVVDGSNALRSSGPSFVAQFKAEKSDAIWRVQQDVIDVCNALLLPGDDGFPQWKHRYGDAMVSCDDDDHDGLSGLNRRIAGDDENHHFVVGEDGKLQDRGEIPQDMRDAIEAVVDEKIRNGEAKEGEFILDADATVTPGCGCPTCNLIRVARKHQGVPVRTHDGNVEVQAPETVLH